EYDVSAERPCRHDAWYKRIGPRWTRLYVYPVILQAADALAVSFTPVTYFCTLRGFTSSPPCCNLNYLGLIIGK
ncbi:TPA: hypothetical protein JDY34_11250, partial [Citrobacter freundii]|nr:hypothetical protein [Citrobacter freundii]HAU4701885.1 hypothetical protein [Citrobacter freundii]